MSDLSQQSMQNQLNAVTSFLREDMTVRARQHAEQIYKNKETDTKQRIFMMTIIVL